MYWLDCRKLGRILTTRYAVSADALAGPPAVELEPAGVGVIRDRRGVRAGHEMVMVAERVIDV